MQASLTAVAGTRVAGAGRSPRLPYLAAVGLLAVVYFSAARLGFVAAVAHGVVSSAWPPAGVALVALLLWGARYWPGIAIGALVANAASGVPLLGAVERDGRRTEERDAEAALATSAPIAMPARSNRATSATPAGGQADETTPCATAATKPSRAALK